MVLGPPTTERAAFLDFQARAATGDSVAEHAWAEHEHAALDALTAREHTLATHTVLETWLGAVLQVNVIIADVERQWVRHADGLLYASLTIDADDVRPHAAGLAWHDAALVSALNRTAEPIAALDQRAWLAWSSCTIPDADDDTGLPRSAALLSEIADLVRRASPLTPAHHAASDAEEIALEPELLVAIRLGREHAAQPTAPITRELRALRHRDPLRVEWTRVLMDAFYLAALDTASLPARVAAAERASLAFLYVGRDRMDHLKAAPDLTPRFRGELAARTFLTAYALERLAPMASAALWHAMNGGATRGAAER